MFWWLVAVAVVILIWGRMWRGNPMMALGVLIGLPIAWVCSRLLTPYVTGMKTIPLWIPPLPLAIVALTLFVAGAIVWFRGPSSKSSSDRTDESDH